MSNRALTFMALSVSVWYGSGAARAEETAIGEKSVSAWLTQLKSDKPDERKMAAMSLSEIPRRGLPPVTSEDIAKIVAALGQALKDSDQSVRTAAAASLPSYETAAKPTVPSLIELLADGSEEVSDQASLSLAQLGPPAFPELLAALKNKSAKIREGAAQSFAQMHISQPHDGLCVRQHSKEILPALLDTIENDAELKVQATAIFALETFGSKAVSAVPFLVKKLLDKEPDMRWVALESLQTIGAGAKPLAVPKIIETMKASKENARLYVKCAAALAAIGMDEKEAADAVPALIEGLKDKRFRGSEHFSEALVKAGKTAVPALLELSRGDQETNRASAMFTLAMIGPDAKSTQTELLKAVKDPSAVIRKCALMALTACSADDADVNALIRQAVNGQQTDLQQREAMQALRFGGAAARALLLEYLKHDQATVRSAAAESLGAMRSAASENVPVLIETLKDSSKDVRESAAFQLGELGIAAKDALPALKAVSASEKKEPPRTTITEDAITKINDAVLEAGVE